MLKINNKGQSLVMFVLIIPIFLLILTLVYDVGNAIYEKDRLSNTNYLTIEYGLNNIDTVTENDLKNLIEQNTSNLKYIYVTIEENQIEIKMEKDAKSIIGKMFNFNLVKIISHYKIWSPFSRSVITKEMTDFKILSSNRLVQMTQYGNDIKVIANFSDENFEYNNDKIKAHSLIIYNKSEKIEYTP